MSITSIIVRTGGGADPTAYGRYAFGAMRLRRIRGWYGGVGAAPAPESGVPAGGEDVEGVMDGETDATELSSN